MHLPIMFPLALEKYLKKKKKKKNMNVSYQVE